MDENELSEDEIEELAEAELEALAGPELESLAGKNLFRTKKDLDIFVYEYGWWRLGLYYMN